MGWATGESPLGTPTCNELHEGPPVSALRPLLHGAPRQLHEHVQRVRTAGSLVARVRGQQQAALHPCRQRAMALQQHVHQGAAQGLWAAQTLVTSVLSVMMPSRTLQSSTHGKSNRVYAWPVQMLQSVAGWVHVQSWTPMAH